MTTTYLNRAEAAKALEISEPTLADWIEQGAPVAGRGGRGRAYRLDVAAIRAWRDGIVQAEEAERAAREAEVARHQQRLDLGEAEAGGEAMSAKARREFYEAELKRMHAARQREELVPVDEVRAEMTRIYRDLATRLRTLPDLLVDRGVIAPAAAAVVADQVSAWQEDMARAHMRAEITAGEAGAAGG
ncbi:DUF1441 family protein [Oceanibacterium hippocampi]|uniref:Phage DNA packaging protein Nu1 n=1 Tax=Oceanibacterium hippocampi TaxID=745714 RepID=A0A1Y5TZM5_9PROT|nr:DUF1441 family protein [Oceanibacterium hippocampi]SLN77574.1 Phage DNA packaging protein Nu1 [Oceanibacterium hippocampi]